MVCGKMLFQNLIYLPEKPLSDKQVTFNLNSIQIQSNFQCLACKYFLRFFLDLLVFH